MRLRMYAKYKVLKLDANAGHYVYLTSHDLDELPFPGAFGFTIGGLDIPFDFYESTTHMTNEDTFESFMGCGKFVEGGLIEDYDDVYAEVGLSRFNLTPEYLSAVSHIYEFYLNFEDAEGDEYDSGTFEENTSDQSLFKVELLAVSFIDEREIECAVREEVLAEYSWKF